MADRYWILGTGTWDSTTTTNWSDTSGGTGGFSVPTAADNVFFDANSNVGTGAFTVTMANSPRVCNDFTASGLDGVMTLAGTSIGLNISGSLTFQATNFSATYTGITNFNATSTGKIVTTNGVSFGGQVYFNGVGGGWTLGSALNIGGSQLTFVSGTFDTSSAGNYAVTAGSLYSAFGSARTINLNASIVALSAATPLTLSGANLTFNAGTSTINCSTNSLTFSGNGLTFYNVAFTSTALASPSISGANTFNNLTITGRTTIGIGLLSISANQTINGTFTVSASTASAYRIQISSDTVGTTRTLTCAAVSLTDTDFRDITIAGAAAPASGTRLGDCKGNSGITFPVAKTVYYRQTASRDWGATGSGSWSATSGGALDATMFPLAQDTAVFPAATYPTSGLTTTINASYNIGTIDMSLRTSNTMTLATYINGSAVYGNWINGTGITLSGTGANTFAGRTTQTITSAGRSFTQPITINSPGGTVQLQDALTTGTTRTTTLTSGILDLQSYTLSTGLFASSNSNTRTIAFGTGQISCTGTGTVWNTGTTTGLTVTGTGTISLTSASPKTFAGGGFSYSSVTLNQGGAGALTITGSNTFSNITNTVQPASVLFTAGTTSTFSNFSLSGTAGNLITIGSVTAASHTLSKASGTVSADYLSISRSTATGGAGWYAGAHSTDGGNNAGWVFTAPAYSITANAGSYAVAGQTAILTRSRLLSGDFGVYTVTGAAAVIDLGGSPIVDSTQLYVVLRSFTERRRF